jgi:acylphosphatase
MVIYARYKMKARVHIYVSGRVQGVFFRDHTQKWASSLGLTGWVKNLYDGRVEAMIEGEKEKVESLIQKIKEGPPLGQVSGVEEHWGEFQDQYSDFEITW